MELGKKIFKPRKKQQLTQEQLGEKVGVTRQTISNWELGETMPDTKQLIALSQALQISIDELVDNDMQGVLEQKVSKVEHHVEKNNNLLKVVIVLSLILITIFVAFISAN